MKLPSSYGFPMVFLWFSYGFPMVYHTNHHGTCSAPIHGVPRRLGQWRPALARREPHPWRGQRRSSTADSPGGRSPPLGFFCGFMTSCQHGIKWIYWIYWIYMIYIYISAIEKRDNPLNGDLRSAEWDGPPMPAKSARCQVFLITQPGAKVQNSRAKRGCWHCWHNIYF